MLLLSITWNPFGINDLGGGKGSELLLTATIKMHKNLSWLLQLKN